MCLQQRAGGRTDISLSYYVLRLCRRRSRSRHFQFIIVETTQLIFYKLEWGLICENEINRSSIKKANNVINVCSNIVPTFLAETLLGHINHSSLTSSHLSPSISSMSSRVIMPSPRTICNRPSGLNRSWPPRCFLCSSATSISTRTVLVSTWFGFFLRKHIIISDFLLLGCKNYSCYTTKSLIFISHICNIPIPTYLYIYSHVHTQRYALECGLGFCKALCQKYLNYYKRH